MARHGGSASGEGRGPSQRQLRVGELIRRSLADVLMRGDVHEPGLSRASITVSEVVVTPDLRHATAYVMPLGGAHAPEMLAALGRASRELRQLVTRGLTLKYAPDLTFRLDDRFDRLEQQRALFARPEIARDLANEDDDDTGEDDRA
jgi:ribosome-binding factor A